MSERKPYLDEFIGRLRDWDREGAIRFCLNLLAEGRATVPELYEEILAPALNGVAVHRQNEDDMIWREHVMTAIVRGVIEGAFPYVLEERESRGVIPSGRRALLACPEEEYHDIGIRMGADFYTIAGYDAIFIGANTPKSNILSAARDIKPAIVDISVSNYLNLFSLCGILPELREVLGTGVPIYLSGGAIARTGKSAADFCADGIVNTFRDVMNLGANE